MDTGTLLGIAGLVATIIFGIAGAIAIRNHFSQRQRTGAHSNPIQSGRDTAVNRHHGGNVENAPNSTIIMSDGGPIILNNATHTPNRAEEVPAAPQTALRFVPILFPQCFWHIGRRGTEAAMQIVTDWHVTNISQVPVRLLSARLLQPQLDDPEAFSVIFAAESRSSMHRANVAIPPGETWHTSIQFYTGPPVQEEGTYLDVAFVVIDQYTHEHRVALTLRYF